ncbi:CDP-glycerol glycerophosphotransferase family protein [Anaerobacillus sp. CMMVII]|uniref:CDP-glycerol glycerophosphotransferase family protein n=1 Tax=Anaerobacillus sp. CMMVII TaxID=2755588 RepID=UPI0021C4E624|nr:CDP-glycerol glycerophosphotransferase family protein [Anaerobacillus sp. CMMVII]
MNSLLKKIKHADFIKKIYKLIFMFLSLMPRKKKTIVFESFLGKQYSCNPRAMYEYVIEHYPDYDCYWSYDPVYVKQFQGYDLKLIRRFSVSWLLTLSRAKYWVSNSRLPLWIPKPPKTIYLQTWHGTPLKKLGVDIEEVHMPGTTTAAYKQNFTSEASRWDMLLSPNAYSSAIFKRAFHFEKEMIESGYPRNDYLYNHSLMDLSSIRNKLNIPVGKKVILYAPTWRDNDYHAKGKYKFSLKLDLKKLQQEVGDDYVIVLRLHYLISDNLDLSEFEGFAINASTYSDIRDLYVIADLLITDYSSVFFDYANLNRPMIFFVYDIDTYRDQLRGFYFDFEREAPGPLVKDTEAVIAEIRKLTGSSFSLPDHFTRQFTYLEDGAAAKRAVEALLEGK